jgi:hypothetical protein
MLVLPKPVFSTTCESRSIRIGGRSVVGSTASATGLAPRGGRCSRAKSPDPVIGLLIVLITAFLLIDVKSE